MNNDKEVLLAVKKIKTSYFGDIMRVNKDELLQVIMQDKIDCMKTHLMVENHKTVNGQNANIL